MVIRVQFPCNLIQLRSHLIVMTSKEVYKKTLDPLDKKWYKW